MLELIDIALLAMMVVSAFAVLWLRNLFAVTMLSGLYSLLAATLYVLLDAVDVAFTEAAVGAGVTTVLMLGTLTMVEHEEKPAAKRSLLGLVVVMVTGALLIYSTGDMPMYGDPEAPIHQHVMPRYILDSPAEVGPTNVVTSVLASYRGYDTLGETTVVFTAAIGVLALLGWGSTRRRRRDASEEEPKS